MYFLILEIYLKFLFFYIFFEKKKTLNIFKWLLHQIKYTDAGKGFRVCLTLMTIFLKTYVSLILVPMTLKHRKIRQKACRIFILIYLTSVLFLSFFFLFILFRFCVFKVFLLRELTLVFFIMVLKNFTMARVNLFDFVFIF